jgi:hypothetical protein
VSTLSSTSAATPTASAPNRYPDAEQRDRDLPVLGLYPVFRDDSDVEEAEQDHADRGSEADDKV